MTSYIGRRKFLATLLGGAAATWPLAARATSPLFLGRRIQLVQLAAFHRLPATYSLREMAESGGLMSYGPNIADAFRQAGVYAGRILKECQAGGPAGRAIEQASCRNDLNDSESF